MDILKRILELQLLRLQETVMVLHEAKDYPEVGEVPYGYKPYLRAIDRIVQAQEAIQEALEDQKANG